MNRFWMLAAALLLVLPLAAGCAQKKTDTAAQQPAATEQGPAGEATPAMGEAAPTGGAEAPPADMALTAMTLEGKVGCGHCTYHVTDSCALALQTEDGKVYVIKSAPDYDAYFGDRFSGKHMKVAGQVGEQDGRMLVYAEQVEVE